MGGESNEIHRTLSQCLEKFMEIIILRTNYWNCLDNRVVWLAVEIIRYELLVNLSSERRLEIEIHCLPSKRSG
jgi:hypothetical protein